MWETLGPVLPTPAGQACLSCPNQKLETTGRPRRGFDINEGSARFMPTLWPGRKEGWILILRTSFLPHVHASSFTFSPRKAAACLGSRTRRGLIRRRRSTAVTTPGTFFRGCRSRSCGWRKWTKRKKNRLSRVLI